MPQIVDAVRVPVIPAGGIADGRGIAATLALGPSGVKLGTAFLGCPETAVTPLYRARLRAGTDEAIEMTSAVAGRRARAMRNRFVPRWPIPRHWSFRCGRASPARYGKCRTKRYAPS